MLEDRIRIISAGAGSGKTHRLTEELAALLRDAHSGVSPEGIVATTFTRKAAAELVERLRQSLFKKKKSKEAEKLAAGLIGTVNSISGILLQQIAFEAGISPQLEVVPDEDQQVIFNKALAGLVDSDEVSDLEQVSERLEIQGWKEQLKIIVDAARSNNCSKSDLPKFAKKSVSSLKKYLPAVSSVDASKHDRKLASAVTAAISNIRKNTGDTTAGTKKYLEFLEGVDLRLRVGQFLTWKEWVDLATSKPTKSSEALSDPVRDAASIHASHPRFHSDIEGYIITLFSLAADLIDHYQSYKKERGLMDFVDQESQLLKALDSIDVQERLSESLDLLLVDEFQDTSPIQLALFLKLTSVVKKSIWVGDPKQSIYGFRGADPSLMAAVTKAVPVKPSDVLASSYRSRPDLVKFVNKIFVPAFSSLLPKKQVELIPERPDPAGAANAIRLWPLVSSNRDNRLVEIADGIVALVREAPVIYDKPANKDRGATAVDIAVLCRANDDCRDIASLLAERGIRAAIGRPGLTETPEGKLVLACVRYFLSPFDTLANAEIQVLTSCDPNPESWLADRLAWLSSGKRSHEWGGGHQTLSTLRELAQRGLDFSPSEVVDEIIEAIDLRRIVVGWGEHDRRLGNLEIFRSMVRSYEDSCRHQMSAATVSGFLLWLSELSAAGKDSQAEGQGVDAVSLVTCHSSKGLEWPIVVVATLDSKIRERVWGAVVNDDRTSVPLDKPLEGRWIRLWPWPYGKKTKDTGLLERLQGSDIMNRALDNAEAEELRLLYVTLTRARDYLVLCINNKGVSWLDLAFSKAKLALPPLDAEKTISCGWGDKDTKLNFQVQLSKQSDTLSTVAGSTSWLKARSGRKIYPPARLNPSSSELPDQATVTIGSSIITGSMIPLIGTPSYDHLGNAIHNFIAVDFEKKMDHVKRLATLDRMLLRYKVAGVIASSAILANCDGFYKFVVSLNPTRVLTEWPLQMKSGGQLLSGTADMVLDTPEGWVVIDHKTFPGPQSKWAQEAEGYAGQLHAYSEVLKRATGKTVAALYIHFVVGGGVVRVTPQLS